MSKYTGKENILFSQIAYRDFSGKYELYKADYPDGKVPLSKLLSDSDLKTMREYGLTDSQLNSWKIADVHDTNSENGFSACIIETEPGKAAVAFRGSENMMDHDNAVHDWANADFALLNQTQTAQHAEVDKFLAKNKDLLSNYDIEMTGHSLGGNLAEYATIVSGDYGLDGNVKHCTSLDGPGFNKEFLSQHSDQINHMKDVMTHYRWSLVGNCLNSAAQENIKAEVKGDSKYDAFGRHDMIALDLDKNGNLKESSRFFDPFDGEGVNDFTSGVDSLPQPVKHVISFGVRTLFVDAIDKILEVKDTINKVKGVINQYFGGNTQTSGGGGGHSFGGSTGGHGGGSHSFGGGSRKDRLLVSPEAMRKTITRYNHAREELEQARKRMDDAWDQLNRVWDGGIKLSFMAQWTVLMGNIQKSETAVAKTIRGLTAAVNLFETTEQKNTSSAQSLSPGVVPPLF